MDFPGHHTCTALPTRDRKVTPDHLDSVRCSLIGNSFQCGVVAWLLQHWGRAAELIDEIQDVADMRCERFSSEQAPM
eukprot:6769589-Karenia_brevis.AAC.1